jgi:glycerophosphoryl diester phosphodiesterase
MGLLDRSWPWPWRGPDAQVGVLAHRGGRGPYPENSLAAFASALEAGADGVELDVRGSAEGVPVVHHDPRLPDGRAIHELPAAALASLVPTLADALDACAGAVVDVEVKNSPGEPGHDPDETLAGRVAELVTARTGAPGGPAAAFISSFSFATVAAARAADRDVPTGLLVHPALDPFAGLEQAVALGCTTLLPFRAQLTPRLSEAVHSRGLALVVWTVNDEAELAAASRAGADAVVTDNVELALGVLGRR